MKKYLLLAAALCLCYGQAHAWSRDLLGSSVYAGESITFSSASRQRHDMVSSAKDGDVHTDLELVNDWVADANPRDFGVWQFPYPTDASATNQFYVRAELETDDTTVDAYNAFADQACLRWTGTVVTPGQYCTGDCNGDYQISDAERNTCLAIFGGSQPVADCPACDSNGDGTVDVSELLLMNQYYGASVTHDCFYGSELSTPLSIGSSNTATMLNKVYGHAQMAVPTMVTSSVGTFYYKNGAGAPAACDHLHCDGGLVRLLVYRDTSITGCSAPIPNGTKKIRIKHATVWK